MTVKEWFWEWYPESVTVYTVHTLLEVYGQRECFDFPGFDDCTWLNLIWNEGVSYGGNPWFELRDWNCSENSCEVGDIFHSNSLSPGHPDNALLQSLFDQYGPPDEACGYVCNADMIVREYCAELLPYNNACQCVDGVCVGCPDGQVCINGTCRVGDCEAYGLSTCVDECVDTDTSNSHCGTCESPCDVANDFSCQYGACICPDGLEDCGGFCNDTCSEHVWYGLGGSDIGEGISNTQSSHSGDVFVAVDSAGNPMVAWEDNLSRTPEIYVKGYDDSVPGGAWVEVGVGSASGAGISTEPGDACCQRLVMDHTDKPVIMWHELTSGEYCDIYVKTFDDSVPGGAWVEVGEGSASGFGISGNLGNSHTGWMDLDGNGFPVVAWTITPPERRNEIYVKRFNGSNWVEMGAGSASGGGISANEGVSFDPHVALDSTGNPFVAWYDESGGSDVYIKKFDGTNWVEVGTGSASGGGITNTDRLLTGDYALAVDEADNPIVAWADDSSGNIEVYVMKYDGSDWIEVGAGSTSGGGISSSAGDSTWPSMVIDSMGMPVVAWRDDSSGCREVYVKRFNGDSWEEIGEGSATGGGVSNSGQASTKCIGSHNNWSTISLGVGGGRICVTWYQWSDVQHTTMQIFLMCVDE